MFAKNRCRVASFSLRCLRLSKRFCKKSQNRCTLRLEFICKWKIGTQMTHIQIMLKCQLVELCVLFFKFWIVLDIFFISPNSRPLPTFLPFPHGTRRRIQAWGPTPPVPSRDASGGPAPPSSCSKGSSVWCKSSVHADLHEQPGDPSGKAGEAGWGWAEAFGWREVTFLEDASHFYTFLVWPRPEACIFFLFPGIVETMSQVIYAIIDDHCRVFCLYIVYVLAFVSHTSWPCAHPRQNLMKV